MKNKKMNNFFKTLKPILIFSFIINIILLSYIYYLKTSHHTIIFAGDNEYLNIKSGVITLNYDINVFVGNNLEYINEEDIKIKEIKIGYYLLEDENLKEIISYYEKFEESTSLKEMIESINSFNISEVAKKNTIFNGINTKSIENNLCLIMEVKTKDGEQLVSKIQFDVSKIN